MKIFKAIIAASIALASPAAAAETWDLGQSGNWQLKLSEHEGSPALCQIFNYSIRGILNISVNTKGTYFIFFIESDPSIVDSGLFYADIDFEITSQSMQETWTFQDAEFAASDGEGTIFTIIEEDPYQSAFLEDFISGDDIHLMSDDVAYASWTLDHSKGAADMLNECRHMIMDEG